VRGLGCVALVGAREYGALGSGIAEDDRSSCEGSYEGLIGSWDRGGRGVVVYDTSVGERLTSCSWSNQTMVP